MSTKRLSHSETVRIDDTSGTRPIHPMPNACACARRLLNTGHPSGAMRILEQEIEHGKEYRSLTRLLRRAQ